MFGENNMRAIVLPVLRVDNVSVATASILVSPPSPMAALGLMHKIGLDLNRAGILHADANPFRSVAFAVHEFEIAAGHRRIPPEMRGESRDGAGSMIDDPEGNLLCTLVISAEIEDHSVLASIKDYLSANMRRYRFGGGRVIRSGIASSDIGKGAWRLNPVETAWDEAEFQRIVRVLPPGSVLVDRTRLLDREDDDPRDALDRLLDRIARVKIPDRVKSDSDNGEDGDGPEDGVASYGLPVPREGEKWSWGKAASGWTVPVAIGWRALCEVRERPGMRPAAGVVGHVWAEDIVGLGEWVSLRRAFASPADGYRFAAWKYREAPPQGPYVVEGSDM
jgi:CRISPR type I-F-associated protein Csy2